ncbi:uncharacterized protein PCL_10935 [Purpureocillium lilacinum]|uniref:Uncharacterized protein n=1 Tax=Purpureocillium lilacinum TaxID=33203 RepID=A0A2U3ECV0_PURLI|nr:uncharacterized protein PCL_10935 [Purpureocillium lilacinum]
MPPRQNPASQASTKGTRAQRAHELAQETVEAQMSLAREYFKSNPAPDGDSDTVLNIIIGSASPEFDRFWTHADEWRLQNRYTSSGLAQEVRSIRGAHSHMRQLWKTSCWEMRCSPLAIVSPRYGMSFQSVTRGRRTPTQTTAPAERLWSKHFCLDLNDLVSHPVWEGESSMLATALQATVIHRTDDRRPWIIRCLPTCSAMEQFMARASQSPFELPVRAAMEEAILACQQQNRKVSPFFRLLRHIADSTGAQVERMAEDEDRSEDGVNCENEDDENEGEPRPTAAYWIRTEDLRSLIKAIDTLIVKGGHPYFPSVGLTATTVHAAREGRSMPYGDEELKKFYKRAWFHEMRQAKREQRSGQSAMPFPTAPTSASASLSAPVVAPEPPAASGVNRIDVSSTSDSDTFESPTLTGVQPQAHSEPENLAYDDDWSTADDEDLNGDDNGMFVDQDADHPNLDEFSLEVERSLRDSNDAESQEPSSPDSPSSAELQTQHGDGDDLATTEAGPEAPVDPARHREIVVQYMTSAMPLTPEELRLQAII